MTHEPADDAVEEIASSLTRRAVELWGAERAEALTEAIDETARNIWLISQDPPPADEEPAFYL